jgi:hypothetical protein
MPSLSEDIKQAFPIDEKSEEFHHMMILPIGEANETVETNWLLKNRSRRKSSKTIAKINQATSGIKTKTVFGTNINPDIPSQK